MSDVKKVAEEELKVLKWLQSEWDRLTKQYGELKYQAIRAEMQLTQLDAQRQKVVEELQTRFGSAGTVDLKTGEFTPATRE